MVDKNKGPGDRSHAGGPFANREGDVGTFHEIIGEISYDAKWEPCFTEEDGVKVRFFDVLKNGDLLALEIYVDAKGKHSIDSTDAETPITSADEKVIEESFCKWASDWISEFQKSRK